MEQITINAVHEVTQVTVEVQERTTASVDGGTASVVDSDFTVTVGTGGDYATINEAISDLSTNIRKYVQEGFTATINLLTGFSMSEQVIVTNGVDLSWIKITSVDAVVPLVRSAITVFSSAVDGMAGIEDWAAAFMAGNSAKLPRISCVFAMDTSGLADYRLNGIYIVKDSVAYVDENCGIHDTDGCGVILSNCSRLIADRSDWSGNGREQAATSRQLAAVKSEHQGTVTLQEATINNQIGYGVVIIGASVATVRDAVISNCGETGLYGGGVSMIHARGVNITLCGTGIIAEEGSTIRLIQSTISNNTTNGVYLANSSVVNSASGTVISNNGADGVRVTGGSKFSITTPTIQNNGANGLSVEGGDAYISTGNISGNTTKDLSVGGSCAIIRLLGTITTSSGNSAANNVTDSNVAAFNCFTRTGFGGIFGRGGKAENRGTATIASGSTSVVVTHGVDFTPASGEVSIAATNSMNSASKFWITGLSATQFTINVNVAPGAGGATFAWNIRRIMG